MEVRHPGTLADELELDLERYRRAAAVLSMPPALRERAEVLGRVAAMLREAEERGQAVDLSHEIVRFIRRFRGALAALGGEIAQA